MPRYKGGFFTVLSAAVFLVLSKAAIAEEARKQPFRYDAAGRRDPFVPLIINNRLVDSHSGRSGDGTELVLRGILWDPRGQSIALLDDLEAKVGDSVRGYTVKAINRDEVVLEAEGQTVVLQIAFDEQAPEPTMGGKNP